MGEWVTADELLALVGVDPAGASAAQRSRADLVAGAINTDITRTIDRDPGDPLLIPADPSLRAAAATAAINAYGRFDTKFDSTNYADLTGQAVKVARDALAYVAPQLERWKRLAIG